MRIYFGLLICFLIFDSFNSSAFPWLDEENSDEIVTTTKLMKKQRKNGKKYREQKGGRPYYGWREVQPLPIQQDNSFWYNNNQKIDEPVQLPTEILNNNQWLLPTTSSIIKNINNWWDNQNQNWWDNQQDNNFNNNWFNTKTQPTVATNKVTTKWDDHPLNNYNPDDITSWNSQNNWNSDNQNTQEVSSNWNNNNNPDPNWNNNNNWIQLPPQPQPQPTKTPFTPQPQATKAPYIPQPQPPVVVPVLAPVIPSQPQPTAEQPKPATPAPQPAGPPGTYDHIIDDNCMKCLCFIESWCSDVGCVMDQGSLSCGWYQLKYEYWLDCGSPGGDWKTCANSKKCAEGCVRRYINRYGQFCTEPGVQPRCQDLVRIHNGGPYGCRSNHTEYYGWYVGRCLIRQPPYENIDSQKIPE